MKNCITTNNVLVCPCSQYQLDLVKFLKAKGHFVIGVNPIKTISTNLCDHHIDKDIYDVEAIIQCLPSIRAVFTDQSDISVITCQKIAEIIGVAVNDMSSVRKFSCDKQGMYKHIKDQQIDVLNFEFVCNPDEITLKLPFILKPVDSSNSKGVYLITQKDHIDEFFKRSLCFSKSKILIAQQYEDSDFQITVEGICTDKKHYCLASSYKGEYWTPSVCSYVRWPLQDRLSVDKIENIYSTVDKYVESTGIDCCITHAEFIISKNGRIYLNEIGCRGGGFEISSKLAPWVSGVDFYEAIYQYIMYGNRFIPSIIKKRAAIIKFFNKPVHFENLPPNTLDFKQISDIDHKLNPENVRRGYLVTIADDSKQLNENLSVIK